MTKKILVTLTGASGSGKTTLLNRLVDTGKFSDIVSHTTRNTRPGEINGKSYHFVTLDEFNDLSRRGELMESVFFNGMHYGISKAEFEKVTDSGKIPIVIVEPTGLQQLKKFVDKEKDIEVLSYVLVLDQQSLIDRYLQRLNSEDITDNKKRNFHAGRLSSISHEMTWLTPKWFDIYRLNPGEDLPTIVKIFKGADRNTWENKNETHSMTAALEIIPRDVELLKLQENLKEENLLAKAETLTIELQKVFDKMYGKGKKDAIEWLKSSY